MEPILHLSLPVRDLVEATTFYVDVLGCSLGRVGTGGADVWFYGMQVTLQARPDQVLTTEAMGVRHFGVALSPAELDTLLRRLEGHDVSWLHAASTDHEGTPQEQRKAKILDPSGNVIELKAYPDPAGALQAPHLEPTEPSA